jgi:hypothetical protein
MQSVKTQQLFLQDENFADGLPRFVCAMMQKVSVVTRLRSYRVPEGNDQDPTILEAALATSAAPTYFSKVKIEGSSFVDGALGANNPTEQLEDEANDILCSRKNDLTTRVACLLSIGTGRMDLNSVSDRGIVRLVEALKKEATETERTHASVLRRWHTPGQESRYFRFNVEQGLNEVKLAEFNKRDAIQAGAFAYLLRHDVRDRLQCCVEHLMTRQRRSIPAISAASILICPDNSTCTSVLILWLDCSFISRRSLTIRARRRHVLRSVSIKCKPQSSGLTPFYRRIRQPRRRKKEPPRAPSHLQSHDRGNRAVHPRPAKSKAQPRNLAQRARSHLRSPVF